MAKKSLPNLFGAYVLENNGTISFDTFCKDSRFAEVAALQEQGVAESWYNSLLNAFRIDVNLLIRESNYDKKSSKSKIVEQFGVAKFSLEALSKNIDDIWLSPYPELHDYSFFRDRFLTHNCYAADLVITSPPTPLDGYEAYLKEHNMVAFKSVFEKSFVRNKELLTNEIRDYLYVTSPSMTDLAKKYHKNFKDMVFIVAYLGADKLPECSRETFKRYFLDSARITPGKIIEKNPHWKKEFYSFYDAELRKLQQSYYDISSGNRIPGMSLDKYLGYIKLMYKNQAFIDEVTTTLKSPLIVKDMRDQYRNYIMRHVNFEAVRFGAAFGLSHSAQDVYDSVIDEVKEAAVDIYNQKGFVAASDIKAYFKSTCTVAQIAAFCGANDIVVRVKETAMKSEHDIFKSAFLKIYPADYQTMLPIINALHKRYNLSLIAPDTYDGYYRAQLTQLRKELFELTSKPIKKISSFLGTSKPQRVLFYLDGLALLGKKKYAELTEEQLNSVQKGLHPRITAEHVVEKLLTLQHSADYDTFAQSLKIPDSWGKYLFNHTRDELFSSLSRSISLKRIAPAHLKTIPSPYHYFRGIIALSYNTQNKQLMSPIDKNTMTAFCKVLTPYQIANAINDVIPFEFYVKPETIFIQYKGAFEWSKDVYLDPVNNYAQCSQKHGIPKTQVKELIDFFTNASSESYDKLLEGSASKTPELLRDIL